MIHVVSFEILSGARASVTESTRASRWGDGGIRRCYFPGATGSSFLGEVTPEHYARAAKLAHACPPSTARGQPSSERDGSRGELANQSLTFGPVWPLVDDDAQRSGRPQLPFASALPERRCGCGLADVSSSASSRRVSHRSHARVPDPASCVLASLLTAARSSGLPADRGPYVAVVGPPGSAAQRSSHA